MKGPQTPERLSPTEQVSPLSPTEQVSPICLGCPTHQPIRLSSTDYLAAFNHFRSLNRIVEKGNVINLVTIFTRITTRSCAGEATLNERIA